MQDCAQAALPQIFLCDSFLWLTSSSRRSFCAMVFYQPFEDIIQNTAHELLLWAQICSEGSQQLELLCSKVICKDFNFSNCLISVSVFTAFQQLSQAHRAYFLLQVWQQIVAIYPFTTAKFLFYEKWHCKCHMGWQVTDWTAPTLGLLPFHHCLYHRKIQRF